MLHLGKNCNHHKVCVSGGSYSASTAYKHLSLSLHRLHNRNRKTSQSSQMFCRHEHSTCAYSYTIFLFRLMRWQLNIDPKCIFKLVRTIPYLQPRKGRLLWPFSHWPQLLILRLGHSPVKDCSIPWTLRAQGASLTSAGLLPHKQDSKILQLEQHYQSSLTRYLYKFAPQWLSRITMSYCTDSKNKCILTLKYYTKD